MDQFALGANECLGITKTTTSLKILGQTDECEVTGGEIIKILRLVTLGGCFIKLYSIQKRNLILSHKTYSCDHNAIKILSENLALMLITIGDRDKRLMICNNSDNERFLMNLKLNDLVKVNKYLFNRDHHVVCTVKYIGPVSEIGPGVFIGCTLYDEDDAIYEKNKLASKYFNCNETNGFIRNCGCFFTRTILLDQSIDNLMKIVKAAKRNNAKRMLSTPETSRVQTDAKFLNKPTTFTNDQLKLQNNTTVTVNPSSNNLPKETISRPYNTEIKKSSMESKDVTTETKIPEKALNSIHTQPQIQNNFTSTTFTSTNKILQPNRFKSADVYPETKTTSTYSYSYVPESRFFNLNPSTGHNTANDRSSLFWTPSNINLNQSKPTPPPPPKNSRCSVM